MHAVKNNRNSQAEDIVLIFVNALDPDTIAEQWSPNEGLVYVFECLWILVIQQAVQSQAETRQI